MSLLRSPLGELQPGLAVGRAARRTFRSLRVRNYRLFFAGQLVSVSGTWMQTVAQSWLVLNLTGSGVDLGLTLALQFLPMLLFGMWGGLIADRFDKRRVLVAAQVAAGVLALVLWALVRSGSVELWMVEVLAFLLGTVFVVDLPARQAFVTEMVGTDDLPNAVGLNSAIFNAGRLVGPAAAGAVISVAGVAPAFLVNAVTYVVVVAALCAMRPEELHRTPVDRTRRPGQIREGVRHVWQTPELRRPLLLMSAIGTFGLNFVVILPLLARYTLHGGARLYGVLTASMGLGSLIGALIAAGRARPSRPVLLGSAVAFGVLTTASAAAPDAATATVVLLGAGLALMLFLATANSTLQLHSSQAMRGRVMAIYGLVLLGTTPVGGPLLGAVSSAWGARVGMAVSGLASLAAALVAVAAALRDRARSAADGGADPGVAGLPGAAAPAPAA